MENYLADQAGVLCAALYAEGMLDLARRQLSKSMESLEPAIRYRLPVVGLEPSCIASFRDELAELFPHDKRAVYLKNNTFTFAEYLQRRDFKPPRLAREGMVHALQSPRGDGYHCGARGAG